MQIENVEDGQADEASFIAIVAPIQSAIKIGDLGARIQFDVAESDLPGMLPLLAMRGKLLRVRASVAEE
jgi:hypothetical protein